MDKTVQYKRTLRGSVGAGVSALFNGNGRRYYILEHKEASKFHRAGDSQKIIIDEVELGRDANCQVRFDDTFSTVSRRHAAIIKDGDRWKLVQLSKTNSTFLNGRKIETEWYLENGDEIQLSVGGPRLGFIVPEGKQSLVSSIKMTERLELFRKQALKPYKTAIASLAIVLVICSAFGGYGIYDNYIKNQKNQEEIAKVHDAQKLFEQGQDSINKSNAKQLAEWEQNKKVIVNQIASTRGLIKPEISDLIKQVCKDVYFIQVRFVGEINGQRYTLGGGSGTAFLLSDGKLVTARHCVSERYDPALSWNIIHITNMGGSVTKEITLHTPSGKSMSLPSDAFRTDERYDITVQYSRKNDEGEIIATYPIKIAYPMNGSKAEQMIFGTDWAYANLGYSGNIVADRELSKSLAAGTEVHVLGYPKALGVNDGEQLIEPIYNKLSVSRNGLNDAGCIMVSSGIDHGNSGGPVFALVGKKLHVVGIVSRGDLRSEQYNHLVPICNLK